VAKNLPAQENFRRHWEVQKRHSGALAPLLETLIPRFEYWNIATLIAIGSLLLAENKSETSRGGC